MFLTGNCIQMLKTFLYKDFTQNVSSIFPDTKRSSSAKKGDKKRGVRVIFHSYTPLKLMVHQAGFEPATP